MHEGAYKFIARSARTLGFRQSVIELGSRHVPGAWPYSGPVRPLFMARSYLGVDVREGPNVDVVANAAVWRPDNPVDTVICAETLEHTDEAAGICHTAWEMLADDGAFVVTTAGVGRAPHSAVDGGPLRDGEFYRNVTEDDLRGWLSDFTKVIIDDTVPGDIYALALK
jgi:hypothetical protein